MRMKSFNSNTLTPNTQTRSENYFDPHKKSSTIINPVKSMITLSNCNQRRQHQQQFHQPTFKFEPPSKILNNYECVDYDKSLTIPSLDRNGDKNSLKI